MTWVKKGDFRKPFEPSLGSKLNRVCYYENSTSVDIEKVILYGYTNDVQKIVLQATSTNSYERLAQQLKQAGFPLQKCDDQKLMKITLTSLNPTLIQALLYVVRDAALELADIEDDICQSLGIEPDASAENNFVKNVASVIKAQSHAFFGACPSESNIRLKRLSPAMYAKL